MTPQQRHIDEATKIVDAWTRTGVGLIGDVARALAEAENRVAELEAECDRLQSLANVYRTEVMASRNERAAFFSKTMNYEEWQAASKQVEIARADTDAARAANEGQCYPFSTQTCDKPGCTCREEKRAARAANGEVKRAKT